MTTSYTKGVLYMQWEIKHLALKVKQLDSNQSSWVGTTQWKNIKNDKILYYGSNQN